MGNIRQFQRGAPAGPSPAPQGGGRFSRQAPPPADDQPEDDGGEGAEPAQPARGGRFGGGAAAPAPSRFGRGGGAPPGRAAPAARAPTRQPGGRFTGLRSELPQTPSLSEGDHEVEVVVSGERQSQKNGGGDMVCHVDVTVIDSNSITPGEVRHLMFMTSGNGGKRGRERLMFFVRTIYGYADDDSFIADVPDYPTLIGAVCGEPDCEAQPDPNGQPWGQNPLQGMRAIVHATKGQLRQNNDGTQDQFYNYDWEPIPQ